MGGYGALLLAFKHPDLFTVAASLSGALILGRPPEEMIAGFLEGPFGKPFNPEYWDKNNPFNLIKNIKGTKLHVYIICGDDDDFGLYIGAARFHEALVKAKIPHEYRIYDGIHRWSFWGPHTEEVLIWFASVFAPYY
jgi:S-formylglutathione hydrolase FrmB